MRWILPFSFLFLISCGQQPQEQANILLSAGISHLWKIPSASNDVFIPKDIPDDIFLDERGWVYWKDPQISGEIRYWLVHEDKDPLEQKISFQVLHNQQKQTHFPQVSCHDLNPDVQKVLNLFSDDSNPKKNLIWHQQRWGQISLMENCLSPNISVPLKTLNISEKVMAIPSGEWSFDLSVQGEKNYGIAQGSVGVSLSPDGLIHVSNQADRSHPIHLVLWVTDSKSVWKESLVLRPTTCDPVEEVSTIVMPDHRFRERGMDYSVVEFDEKTCRKKIFHMISAGVLPDVDWEVVYASEQRKADIELRLSIDHPIEVVLLQQHQFDDDIVSIEGSGVRRKITVAAGSQPGSRNVQFYLDNGRSKKHYQIPLLFQKYQKASYLTSSTYHQDGRPKYHLINEDFKGRGSYWVLEQMERYAPAYGVQTQQLKLLNTRKSLLGYHYTLGFLRGGQLDEQNIIVSTSLDEQGLEKIYSIYNGVSQRYDGQYGAGLYVGRKHVMKQWLQSSYGAPVEQLIHPDHNEVLSQRHVGLSRRPFKKEFHGLKGYQPYKLPDESYDEIRTNGRALVFAMSPSLQKRELFDQSPSYQFQNLFQWRSLQRLRTHQGRFFLYGDRVRIVDWQAPFQGHVSNEQGVWRGGRGDASWMAAQTYYHLDAMLAYLEKIGFVGRQQLVSYPVVADPDGLHGADNSAYDRIQKALSFGTGGIDDVEDPDVLIHELMHALLDQMIPNFEGGDSGAIGEGAGDDLAVSYRLRRHLTTEGANRVFRWDATQTWNGRRTDVLHSFYHHARHHEAHTPLQGFLSDELWSTPLVSARKILLRKGYSMESIDRIILQGYLGIGYAPKMRDVAMNIVTVAQMMGYPQVAKVFFDRFYWHGILSKSSEHYFLEVKGPSLLEHGQPYDVHVTLQNQGSKTLKSSSLWVSAKGVQMSPIQIKSLEPGEKHQIDVPVFFGGDMNCQQTRMIQFSWITEEKILAMASLEKTVGHTETVFAEWQGDAPVVAEKPLELQIEVTHPGILSEHFQIGLDIEHTWLGDVQMELVHPSGVAVKILGDLRDEGGSFIGWIPGDRYPVEDIKVFSGLSAKGVWKLRVRDIQPDEDGAIKVWKLRDRFQSQCLVDGGMTHE